MTAIDRDDIAAIARAVADAAFDVAERERKKQGERIYGMKTIAAECGVSHDVLTRWVNAHGFPLDKDPRGYSVRRWNMERWFEARRRAVESLKR